MGTPTAHYGIIKPAGSDPFRAADFATAYDLIDQKIYEAAQAAAGGGGGGGGGTVGDASTLQGHPAAYFATADHTHAGGGGGSDAATLQGHPAAYFYSPGNPPPASGGSGGTVTQGNTSGLSGRFASFTPDGSGFHDLTHGFGFTPGVVTASGLGPTGGGGIPATILPHNFTSTTLRVRILDQNGSPVTSAVTIMLIGVI
jgi:hypothetical protein